MLVMGSVYCAFTRRGPTSSVDDARAKPKRKSRNVAIVRLPERPGPLVKKIPIFVFVKRLTMLRRVGVRVSARRVGARAFRVFDDRDLRERLLDQLSQRGVVSLRQCLRRDAELSQESPQFVRRHGPEPFFQLLRRQGIERSEGLDDDRHDLRFGFAARAARRRTGPARRGIAAGARGPRSSRCRRIRLLSGREDLRLPAGLARGTVRIALRSYLGAVVLTVGIRVLQERAGAEDVELVVIRETVPVRILRAQFLGPLLFELLRALEGESRGALEREDDRFVDAKKSQDDRRKTNNDKNPETQLLM